MLTIQWPTGQWDSLAERARVSLRDFLIEFFQQLGNKLVEATPVKYGFLRGSWHAAVNSEPEGGTSGVTDPGGAMANARITAAAASVQVGDIFYIVNTAAYAARLEYGFVGADSLGRVYNQQPRRFVLQVVSLAREIALGVARRLSLEVE